MTKELLQKEYDNQRIKESLGAINMHSRMVENCETSEQTFSLLPKSKENVNTSISEIKQQDIEAKITLILDMFGISPKRKGHIYLSDAIVMAYGDEKRKMNLVRDIYPEIASKYGVTVSQVERLLKNTIGYAWNKGFMDKIEIKSEGIDFGTIKYDRRRPSNGEIIQRVADIVRLSLNRRDYQGSE